MTQPHELPAGKSIDPRVAALKETLENADTKLTSFIKEHPAVMVGVALGVGFFANFLLQKVITSSQKISRNNDNLS